MSKTKTLYTRNEVIAEKYDVQAINFRSIADHVEEWEFDAKQIIEYLRECADLVEAQAMVVRLRDKINQTTKP